MIIMSTADILEIEFTEYNKPYTKKISQTNKIETATATVVDIARE